MWRNLAKDRLLGLFFTSQWNVGVVDRPIHSFLEVAARPPVSWLSEPPRGRYLADPFGLANDGIYTVLVEEFDHRRGSGWIAAVSDLHGASVSPPAPTIPLPTHASYPFLVEYRGEAYCIPEVVEANEAALYRADGWPKTWPPKRWVKVATLVEGFPVVDPSVVQFEGLWWLFCTNLKDEPNAKLRIWHAPTLFGPWEPHSANPVKADVRSARSAGTPFVWEGHLYRPGQDNSVTYGGAVVINRVTKLTRTQFSEQVAAVVAPFTDSPFPLGLHTLSALGDKTLIDGKRRVLNSYELFWREVAALATRIVLGR
jgi:hypothetical protein